MESTPKPTTILWHCVLDRSMRQIYLGTDLNEAKKLAVEGTVLRSAAKMGDAMLEAALAFNNERRQ